MAAAATRNSATRIFFISDSVKSRGRIMKTDTYLQALCPKWPGRSIESGAILFQTKIMSNSMLL